jgi:hypothetical protein
MHVERLVAGNVEDLLVLLFVSPYEMHILVFVLVTVLVLVVNGVAYDIGEVARESGCMVVDIGECLCRRYGLLLTEFARILT